jgi:nucleoid-associated protein YgaU
MRKDAKIGFAIGGVLLAVLTVYVIVVPRHHNALSPNAVTLTVPTDGTAPDTSTPSAATDSTDTKVPETSTALAKNTGDGVNWERLLNGGGNDTDVAPPLMTTTTSPPTSGSGVVVAPPPATASGANTSPSTPPVTLADVTPPAGPATRPAAMMAVEATPAVHTTVAAGSRQYTIKSGQTLSSIAGEVYGNSRFYVAILRANPGLNPNRLHPGDKITLPDAAEVNPAASTAVTPPVERGTAAATGKTYTVKSGDTLYAISKELFGTTREATAIYDLNKQTIGANEARLTVGMILKLPEAASSPTVSAR